MNTKNLNMLRMFLLAMVIALTAATMILYLTNHQFNGAVLVGATGYLLVYFVTKRKQNQA